MELHALGKGFPGASCSMDTAPWRTKLHGEECCMEASSDRELFLADDLQENQSLGDSPQAYPDTVGSIPYSTCGYESDDPTSGDPSYKNIDPFTLYFQQRNLKGSIQGRSALFLYTSKILPKELF